MSRPVALLGVDIGTESARAALLAPDGRILASSSREYGLVCPRPGWAEQDPDLWWRATVANIRDVIAATDVEVVAIGIGGQMHAPVPVDQAGLPVNNAALLWCDKRSAPQCSSILRAADFDQDRALRTTGNAALPTWIGFKLKWLKENLAEVYDRARVFLTCKDYLNLRLTGERYTDFSEASGSFLYDVHAQAWSEELCWLLEVDRAKLPPIVEASEVIGGVSQEASQQTGLAVGTPVVCGGGDMMCLLLGAGVATYGQACDVTGTAADLSVYIAEPAYDRRLMHLHHVVPGGGWISFGILDAGGGSYRWLRDTFAAAEAEQAKAEGVSTYEILSRKAAETPPGAEGLFYLPYLLGERTLGTSHSRGVFFGLTPRHNLGHCARAVMEGVTFDLRQTLEIIEEMGRRVAEIRAIAGGSKSALWCGIKADIYRKPIVTLRSFEGGVVGAAILAGLGVGVYRDAQAAVDQMVHIKQTHHPDMANADLYDRYYRFFKALHDGLQPYYEQLASLTD